MSNSKPTLDLSALPPKLNNIQKSRLRFAKNTISSQVIQVDLRVGASKLDIWLQQWLGKTEQHESSYETLWGREGWADLQKMLHNIEEIVQRIEAVNGGFQDQADFHPRMKWRMAVLRLKAHRGTHEAQIKELVTDFNVTIDAIWLYSETVFDSIHGLQAPGLQPAIRDRLLVSALQSRAGSIALYNLCCNDPSDYYLEIDLRPRSSATDHLHQHTEPFCLFYQLFAHIPHGSPLELRKLSVEHSQQYETSTTAPSTTFNIEDPDFHLSSVKTATEAIIPLKAEESGRSSYLRIDYPHSQIVRLQSSLESLGDLFARQKDIGPSDFKEQISITTRIRLAFKLVEFGFFLLGTPWLSLLESQNIMKMKDDGQERGRFVLGVQTFGLVDILFENSEALSETEQLKQIGNILMEIALDDSDGWQTTKNVSHQANVLGRLPLVERTMGTQYCRATAFCLQHRLPERRFNGLKKYEGSSKDWELYLSKLLQDYYSQVFLRLEELQEVHR